MAELKHLTGPGNYLAVFIRHSSPPELTNKDYHSAQAASSVESRRAYRLNKREVQTSLRAYVSA